MLDPRQLLPLLLLLAAVLLPPSARAVNYDVSASGTGLDLSEAMDLAEPGDTVSLADGIYDQAIVSTRDGTKEDPITVVGGPDAIINGDYSSRSVLITHSFITLKVGGESTVEQQLACVRTSVWLALCTRYSNTSY